MLGWEPTLTNEQMMLPRQFSYYRDNRQGDSRRGRMCRRTPKAAPMGVIRLLKWLS